MPHSGNVCIVINRCHLFCIEMNVLKTLINVQLRAANATIYTVQKWDLCENGQAVNNGVSVLDQIWEPRNVCDGR